MDKLKLMKTFMLTVEEGSMSKAATLLSITKAAASKQIMDLEKSLNAQLLFRTTRKLKLTDVGQLYLESIKKIFRAVAESESIMTYDNPIGTLRVTSHRHFGEKYIVNHMKEFIAKYPNLNVNLELSDRFPDLEKENIDILCGVGEDGPEHLVRKKIASMYHVLCASPAYLQKFSMPKKPNDLKSHRYITHSFRNPDNVLVMANKKIYLDPCITLNDSQTMLKCALDDLGIIKIYHYFVEDYIKEGKLVEILEEYRNTKISMYLFYQQQTFVPAKIRVFIDFITQKIGGLNSF